MATNPSVIAYQKRLSAIRNSKQKAKGAGLLSAAMGGGMKAPMGADVPVSGVTDGKPALFFGNYPIPSALKPRVNPAFDPNAAPDVAQDPYKPTTGLGGWFRQLLGDNSNELNAASAADRAQMLKQEWAANKAQERALALVREQQKGTQEVERMRLKGQEDIHRDDRLARFADHTDNFLHTMNADAETARHNQAMEALGQNKLDDTAAHMSEIEKYKAAMAQAQNDKIEALSQVNAWRQGAPINMGGTQMRKIGDTWHMLDTTDANKPRWQPIPEPGQAPRGGDAAGLKAAFGALSGQRAQQSDETDHIMDLIRRSRTSDIPDSDYSFPATTW